MQLVVLKKKRRRRCECVIFIIMLRYQTLLVNLPVAVKFKTDLMKCDNRHILLLHCSLIMLQGSGLAIAIGRESTVETKKKNVQLAQQKLIHLGK